MILTFSCGLLLGRVGRLVRFEGTYMTPPCPKNLALRTCFNWVIAEYTPAPFPNQPQNELEQLLILATQLDSMELEILLYRYLGGVPV